MKINLLEFTVGDSLFGIRTEYVKYIFDIENIKPSPLMPEYVAGFTTQGKYVYPLICMDMLLGLSKDCSNVIGKTAIVVDVYGKRFALVVDDIRKIQEIEETEEGNDIVNFYNLRGQIIEEITPVYLSRRIKLPPLKQKVLLSNLENKSTEKEEERSFIIFKLSDKTFGIDTEFVKKAEYLENLKKFITRGDSWVEGVFLIKDTPVKAIDLKKVINLEGNLGENLLIVERENKNVGLIVDEIIDIYSVLKSEINTGVNAEDIFYEFLVVDKKVIPVLSQQFINQIIEKYSLVTSESKKENSLDKKESIDILVFKIGNEIFGIKMKNICEVLEGSDAHISNYPSENQLIRGLIARERESFFLISFEKLLGQNIDLNSEDTKILVIKENNIKFALLVSEVIDIQSVYESDLAEFEGDESFIEGLVVLKNKELINLINPLWNIPKFKEEINSEVVN